MDSLRRIFGRHCSPADPANGGGDKGVVHSYLGFYEDLLQDLRHKAIHLLEVGVGEGLSVAMWREYFKRGTITGMDVLPLQALMMQLGVYYFQCDSTDPYRVNDLLGSAMYDVILDDGDHRYESQMATWEALRQHLSPGGIYVVEDVADLSPERWFDLRVRGFSVCDFRPLKGRDDDVLAYQIRSKGDQ